MFTVDVKQQYIYILFLKVLISDYNVCLCEKKRKVVSKLSVLPILIWNTGHLSVCEHLQLKIFSNCLAWDAEARHMYCLSGVGGGGVNFCQVFVFRSFSQKL